MAKAAFRWAQAGDEALILRFILELGEFEGDKDRIVATEATLREWLFEKKTAEVIFVLDGEKEVGFALFFLSFSSSLGRSGLYMEDLYVSPEYRGKGYGRALMQKLAAIARERGLARMDWPVLKTNFSAEAFYRSFEPETVDRWAVMRLREDKLTDLARSVDKT